MHEHPTNRRAFSLGMAVNTIYTVIELVFGALIGSVALVADAMHNLSDVLSLGIAWLAEHLMHKNPTAARTYGYKSGSILAALINAFILLIAMGAIIFEAVGRFAHPEPVPGGLVMIVAGIGILINGGTALLFMRGRHGDLNMRGAFLHMAADAGVSLAVVIAGGLMKLTGWEWLDPAMSIVVALVVVAATWDLLRDAVNLALAAVPRNVDPKVVADIIRQYPSVVSFHDLHIWALSTQEAALTVHLVRDNNDRNDEFICGLGKALKKDGNINHVTIQVEHGDYPELNASDNRF